MMTAVLVVALLLVATVLLVVVPRTVKRATELGCVGDDIPQKEDQR